MTVALPILATQGSPLDPSQVLDIAGGVFALILFAVSLYAWYVRRKISLLIVAVAFLMFFLKTIVREALPLIPGEDLITDLLEFVALAFFFLAIVVRPRKDMGDGKI